MNKYLISYGFNEREYKAASELANSMVVKLNSSSKGDYYITAILSISPFEFEDVEKRYKPEEVETFIIASEAEDKCLANSISKKLASKGYKVQVECLTIIIDGKTYESMMDVLSMTGKKAAKAFGIDSAGNSCLMEYLAYYNLKGYSEYQKAFHWIYNELEAENTVKYDGTNEELSRMASNADNVERMLSYYTGISTDEISSTWDDNPEERSKYEAIVVKGLD